MKHLKLEIIPSWGVARVVEQTHRGNNLTEEGTNRFCAKDGFVILSAAYLSGYGNAEGICVRGNYISRDSKIIDFSDIPDRANFIKRLTVAVREYNETYSDKPAQAKQEEFIEVIE